MSKPLLGFVGACVGALPFLVFGAGPSSANDGHRHGQLSVADTIPVRKLVRRAQSGARLDDGSLVERRAEKRTASESFVTLLSTESYLPGLQALAQSLRDVHSTRGLLVMVPTDLLRSGTFKAELDKAAGCLHFDVRPVDPIANPHGTGRFAHTYTKLNVFGNLPGKARGLQRVVFLDSDCVVLQNIDDLFERPCGSTSPPASATEGNAFASGSKFTLQTGLATEDEEGLVAFLQSGFLAAPDCGFQCLQSTFNSGVFAVTPSAELFAAMMLRKNSTSSADGGDQGLLNSWLAPLWRRKDHRLPSAYNTLKRREEYDAAHFLKGVKVLHNVGIKPWANDAREDARYPLSHGRWKAAYAAAVRNC